MALRLDANVRDPIPYYMLMLDRVRERADEFDILHFHIDQFHFPLFRPIAQSDRDDAARPAGPSRSQAALCRLQRDAAGLDLQCPAQADRQRAISSPPSTTAFPLDLLKPTYKPRGGYLAFLGRISPEKRPDRAIRIAAGARHPAQDRRQGRQGRRGLFPRDASRRCSTSRASNSSARSTSAPRASSSARRARCCFRSIGRSRSGCP